MKTKLLSRFKDRHFTRAVIVMALAVVLLFISLTGGGMGGLAPAEVAFLAGVVMFFYAVLMLWHNVNFYFIMSFLFLILFALLWLVGIGILVKMNLHFIRADDLGWSIGIFCLAGVVAGITGIYKNSGGWQRLPYSGAAFSMLAVFMLTIPAMSPPPGLSVFTLVSGYLILAMQFLVTIALFVTGLKNRIANWPSRTILIIIAVILFVLVLWGYSLTLIVNIIDDRGLPFWKGMYRITSVINLAIAVFTFYSLKLLKSEK